MKAQFTRRMNITLDDDLYRQIESVCEAFGGSMSAVVRECVQNDLPKLVERKKKAQKRRKPLL